MWAVAPVAFCAGANPHSARQTNTPTLFVVMHPSIPDRDASVHWRRMNPRLPVYFISHGGGPWSYMNDPARGAYAQLEAALADMPRQIGVTPTAVLMISAHWEAAAFTLTGHPSPPMVYDYYGFPDYTYQVRYDAPGNPLLAARVRDLIEGAGLPARLDAQRGFD